LVKSHHELKQAEKESAFNRLLVKNFGVGQAMEHFMRGPVGKPDPFDVLSKKQEEKSIEIVSTLKFV